MLQTLVIGCCTQPFKKITSGRIENNNGFTVKLIPGLLMGLRLIHPTLNQLSELQIDIKVVGANLNGHLVQCFVRSKDGHMQEWGLGHLNSLAERYKKITVSWLRVLLVA